MFTGIIEEVGEIARVMPTSYGARIIVKADRVCDAIDKGASVTVNGVCLTVVENGPGYFLSDLSIETLNITTFKDIIKGEKVNLERGAKIGGHLDGHIVTGHIDGSGTICERYSKGNTLKIAIRCSEGLMPYIVYKGSIAVDGISLTVGELKRDVFAVYVIPFTEENTNIRFKQIGDMVNIETDIIGRYVARLLSFQEMRVTEGVKRLDKAFLEEYGFT